MNKSQRIKINLSEPNLNQYIKIKLEQDVDFLEFLTLQLKTKDAYRHFNSDYGILVGRVIANNGIGVPNAKISIFIPLDEDDELDDDIRSIYPYKTPRDKDVNRKRYNLLPRVAEYDDLSGTYKPNQPFGSFPIKPEIITNQNLLRVYKKYYRFTTTTNEFGDYMIFGAPVGLHTVHMSVDITDIGMYSMRPALMINNLGYPEAYFTDGNTKIKPSDDLDDLPHIETQEIDVDIKPFWGDTENFQIGITRADFRIRAELINTFLVFGNIITDHEKTSWGIPRQIVQEDGETEINDYIRKLYGIYTDVDEPDDLYDLIGIGNKKETPIKCNVFSYKNTVSENDVLSNYENINSNHIEQINDRDFLIEKDENGNFVCQIECNRGKIIFDDLGNEIIVGDDYPGGIFTRFRGFFIFEPIDNDFDYIISGLTYKARIKTRIKIPQKTITPESGTWEGNPYGSFGFTNDFNQNKTENWFKQSKLFEAGKIYGVSKFNGIVRNNVGADIISMGDPQSETEFGFFEPLGGTPTDRVNDILSLGGNIDNKATPNNVGIIQTNDMNDQTNNNTHSFPHNYEHQTQNGVRNVFGANWLNFSIYLPNITHLAPGEGMVQQYLVASIFNNTFYSSYRWNDYNPISDIERNPFGFRDQRENLVQLHESGKEIDVGRLLRCDLHWTDFVETPVKDIRNMLNQIYDGEMGNGFTSEQIELIGIYRNGENVIDDSSDLFYNEPSCPFNGGKIPGTNTPDPKSYFFTGKNNCLVFLDSLGIL